jgi:hypothetical protein
MARKTSADAAPLQRRYSVADKWDLVVAGAIFLFVLASNIPAL